MYTRAIWPAVRLVDSGEVRRMRVRLLALLASASLFLLGAVPAQAEGGGNGEHGNGGEGQSYLALGDSVPFGYQPFPALFSDADNFVGYPEIVAERLDLKDVNATCPGEATGGFLSLTGTDNGCRPYRAVAPLHVRYKTSQMDFALKYLRSHKHSISLVTLTLGANDGFLFVKAHPECFSATPPATCPALLGGLLITIRTNLDTILSNIRGAGYHGLIVAVTYYATNYADPVGVGGTLALNAQMIAAGAAHNVLIASGFDAFAPVAATAGGDSCAAGLVIPTPLDPKSPCDVHPTPLGRDLLAGAVIQTIAASCPAHDAQECLTGGRD
jgi:lysophospholipase L1-like esterase